MKIEERIAKKGTFLYDGTVVCDIQILETNFMPGTGDYEDPEEIREDQWGRFFTIRYGSTTRRGEFKAGGGWFDTLEEAINHAEKAVTIMEWA